MTPAIDDFLGASRHTRHSRMVCVFAIQPDAVDDVRATARDIRSSSEDFGKTRADFGLSDLSVWLQTSIQGAFVIVEVAGDLETYFHRTRTDGGLDAWIRGKVGEWVGSEEQAELLYQYPYSEELFSWHEAEGSRA